MSETTPVAVLELQVWASRALTAAGFPGGAVDQAARLVTLAQIVDDGAAAEFVADLAAIGSCARGTPVVGERGQVDGCGLHALALAPGVLDLACAQSVPHCQVVTASSGAWVMPGIALQGALRGRAVLAMSPTRAVLTWPDDDGPALAEAAPNMLPPFVGALGLEAAVPSDGYVIATVGRFERPALAAAASHIRDGTAYARHMSQLHGAGFIMARNVWDGITGWGWKMLVPTSTRSKAQAGGDMGEG